MKGIGNGLSVGALAEVDLMGRHDPNAPAATLCCRLRDHQRSLTYHQLLGIIFFWLMLSASQINPQYHGHTPSSNATLAGFGVRRGSHHSERETTE
jgi:hypothetical protein